MPYRKQLLSMPVMIAFSFVLMSWGYVGHQTISSNAVLSFNQEMEDFNSWIPYIVEHSSDADNRRSTDPDEGSRHYIDIDKYSEFLTDGAISQSMSEVIALHGEYFVYDAGILPWTTIQTYDSLRECLRRADWDRAKYYCADLSHYVADGHMPLHITKNYDGQYTNNDGIHSRYESTMINAYVSQIVYSGDSLKIINNVSQYVFDYLYTDYPYIDSVLDADDYAKSISTDFKSSAYKSALWERSRNFTTLMFKNASHSLAELIYNAWVEAGKPSLTGPSLVDEKNSQPELTIMPNPVKNVAKISFSLPAASNVQVNVIDLTGKIVDQVENKYLQPTNYNFDWQVKNLPSGVYMIQLKANNFSEVKKVVVSN